MKKINFKTILMTLMCVVGLGISPNLWAEGFFSDNACGITIYKGSGNDTEYNSNASGASSVPLGNITDLYLKKWYVATWGYSYACNNSCKMYYRIYIGSTGTGNYSSLEKNQDCTYDGSNAWMHWSGNVNLLDGLVGGNYTLEYYFVYYGKNLNNGSNNYRMTFTFDPKYTISINSNSTAMGSVSKSSVSAGNIDAVSLGTATASTGYHFVEWTTTSSDIDINNATSYNEATVKARATGTVTANFAANTNTAYTVKHYKQKLDGTYPDDPFATDNLTGTTGASVTPAVKTGTDITGFTAPSTQTKTIAADGSLVVIYQYTRKSYTLTWDNIAGATLVNAGTAAGSVKYEATLTAPTYKKDGYNFKGWSPEVPAAMPAENKTFNAVWEEAQKCMVTYDANTGTGAQTDATEYKPNDEVTVKDKGTMAKTGYTFIGWNESADGTGTPHAVGSKFTITGDITLYAKWQINTHRLTWVTDGDALTGDYTHGDAIEYGTAITVPNPPTKTGYSFAGWSNGSSVVTPTTTMPDNDLTYTATWTPITYKVHFDGKGNTGGSMSDQDFTYDEAAKNLTANAFTKTGYTFQGWDTNSAGANVVHQDGASVRNLANTQDAVVNLYAVWSAKTYTVSFSQEGGTGGQTESVTATYDQAMPALQDFTAPVKNGYKFLGYYYNDVQYYTATGISARTWNVDDNVTLTAKWDQIHVYIEGRFRVRASEGGAWKYVESSTGTWKTDSKTIEFTFDDVNNKYVLHTYAYFDELAEKINSETPYFYPASYCASENTFRQLGATSENYQFNKTVKSGDATGSNNFVFGTDCHDSSVDLIYDPVNHKLSYESVAEQHYNVTFIAGGQGDVNTPGTQSVGVRGGWNITATPKDAYTFDHWSTTGGAHVANASSSTTAVTVDGDGTVTANFVFNRKRVYFQMPEDWIKADFKTVYVYFYKGAYWNESDRGSGSKDIQHGPHQMTWTGDGNVYYYDVSFDLASSVISFTNDEQSGYERFNGTSVCYREDFDQNFTTAKMMFVPDNWITHTYNSDKKTDYYNRGSWQLYSKAPEEYYVKHDHTNPQWTTLSELRFEPTENNNIRKTILRDLTANEEYEFKIWKSTNNWFGCTATITGNVDNYKFDYGNGDNCTLKPTYTGDYELTLNVSDMLLSVRYLADFYVRSFPEAVSVVPNGIKRIEPKIDLRDGYDVKNLTVSISNTDNGVATVEQSGYNIIVTGKQNGTTTATITYNYKGNVFAYNLTIVVGPAVTIQAKIEDGDTKWIYTNMVNVHYWLDEKTADVNMTYTESGDDKYYTASIPLPEDQTAFNMMFWYGENIEMSATDEWRKTGDITGLNIYTDGTKTKTQSYCFTINHTAGVDEQRTEEHTTGLCIEGDAIYQVEVTMKNGKMYTSNVVSTDGATVSFFAPNTSAEDYTKGTIRLMKNGAQIMQTITNATPGVYTATLNIPATGDASLSNITAYNGDYYVIAGVSGSELDDNTKMHKFTPRANTAEDYSYYWTVYSGNCKDKNVIAKVANEYNSNLSLTIGADALTQSDGTVAAGNVRFSYEPTTNAFKRAILGASNSNDFLNVYGNNVFADAEATQPLSESQDLSLSKFTDNSDWVYEKVVYVKVDNEESESKVTLKSVFNGQTSHLLGYAIDETTGEEKKDQPKQLTVLGKGSTTGASAYAIRISYDFKKNRLISSWEPEGRTYSSDMSINSDVLFIRSENGDVQQVEVATKSETESYEISSLQHVMFVMEIDGSTDKTSYSQYWISLPFDCQISDVFGVEGYITLDENRIAQKGTWGIMRYRGDLRAQKGWFKETDGFWEWMYENETMYAGEGYVLFFERSSIKDWPTIKDKGGVEKALKRLYFPSKDAGFVMSNTVTEENSKFTCESMRCTIKTPEDREAYDSNWRVIGPKSYNNINAKSIQSDSFYGDQTKFPDFLYTYDVNAESGHKYIAHDGKEYSYQSFHAYMVQYEGTITWMPYTQTTTPATVAARNVENSDFKGGTLTIELVQNNEELDRTFVKLDKNGTTGFDFSQDLTKITENCAQIASVNEDVLYAGSTLPLDIELVPLNVKVTAKGTYDIALKQSLEGLEVKLFDAFEQTITPLDMMSATVTLEKGEYKDRFFLQLTQKAPQTPTSLDGKMEQYNLPMDKTQKLLFNGNIYLINAGRVYNATGAELR